VITRIGGDLLRAPAGTPGIARGTGSRADHRGAGIDLHDRMIKLVEGGRAAEGTPKRRLSPQHPWPA